MSILSGAGETLVSMLYRSRATGSFNESELSSLVAGAREHNLLRQVTGALFYEDGRFMQWLEGPRDSVEELFTTIGRDPRHSEIEIVSVGPTTSRLFADWNLRLLRRGKSVRNPFRVVRPCSSCGAPACEKRDVALKLASGDSTDFDAALRSGAGRVDVQVCYGERLAERYAEMWADDTLSSAESFAGQALALSAFRRLVTPRTAFAPGANGGRILVAPLPGEPHYLRAALATSMLKSAHFDTNYAVPATNGELLSALSNPEITGLVLVAGPDAVGTVKRKLVTRTCELVRRRIGPPIRIALYGNVADGEADWPNPRGPDHLAVSALRLPDCFQQTAYPFH